ncbi:MAG: peptidylprolyl isomerase [Candidatus Marinimicrobia bacterium]|nr:peptidylprolyl isomerase [Candidatus Neomarinimicrobiota bacterium]MDP6593961.1 peptidylprolyl isomerase [Candidatus Neomarinimicrobiota bacterium]MDP6835677.1 peptidylprolyl isomerase [Candidatus Neomarinimicrobiota bacterium]
MMNLMRDRMHFILWFLLIMFLGSMTVGGLVGGADIINQLLGKTDVRKAIAVVNGQIIAPEEFHYQLNHRLEQMRAQGQVIDDRQLDQIRNGLLDELVEFTLIDQQIKEYDITITDDDVYYHLLNSPPPTIQAIEDFQTDGLFDRQKYIQALQNPQADEWRPIEEFVRGYLPRQMLFDQIRESARITEEEVKAEYIKRNLNYTISGVVIRSHNFNDESVNPTADDIENYYFMNPDLYNRDESRVLSYVQWEKNPSAEDTALVMQEAADILERIESGDEFAALANDYSLDPGNLGSNGQGRGGDLGWFSRGQMVKPFEEAAFNTEASDIVGPVESSFGFHIIWVREKRDTDGKEEVLASHILLKVEMGPTTSENIRNQAEQFSFDIEDFGYNRALEMNTLEATPLQPLNENTTFLPGFGYFLSPVRFSFDSEIGDVSEILESDRSFAIFRLDSIIVAGTQPYSEVKNQITNQLKVEKQMAGAKQLADSLYGSISAGTSLESEARYNEKVEFVGPVTAKLNGTFQGIGRSTALVGALLTSEPGDILTPVELARGYAIVKHEDRDEFDSIDWEVKKTVLQKDMLSERENQAITSWLQKIKSEADIEDNRKYYF